MFYENFLKLCAQKGVSPSAVLVSLGMSKGSVTHWKGGKMPHDSTLAKIADYFGVTVDDLTGQAATVKRTDLFTGASPYNADEITDMAVSEIMSRLEDVMKDMTAEELTELERYVDYLINRKK